VTAENIACDCFPVVPTAIGITPKPNLSFTIDIVADPLDRFISDSFVNVFIGELFRHSFPDSLP
jgi:hypothetical protein